MKSRMMMVCCVGLLLLLTIVPAVTHAAVPQLINYQGKLMEDGAPVTGFRMITFSIWDNDLGGEPADGLWHETQDVAVTDGIYNVELGFVAALPSNLYDYDDLFLQVNIQHPTAGWQRLSPLMQFDSTVFALKAAKADSVADGAVTEIMLASGAVTTDIVADGAITAVKVAGGAGSGLDADLLDGQSAEDFLGVAGGTVDGLVTLEGAIGPQLVIHDSGLPAERPGIQFTGNSIHFIAGDDLSDELFGFYSGFNNNRTYDAKLRVYGKANDSWYHSTGMTHNGTEGTIDTDTGDLVLAPAADVRLAAGRGVVYPDGSRQTTAYTAGLEARVADLENEVAALKALLLNVERSGNDIHFNGMNLHVNNGTGSTTGAVNGLGNLIVGYNGVRSSGNVRTGSHNLIIGDQQNYSSYGGLAAGMTNTISGVYASVVGGTGNVASGGYASISGGGGNTASGNVSSVSGGTLNEASGDWASVSGGEDNTASGLRSSVSGGYQNSASYEDTWLGGGSTNTASASYASVTGGTENTANGLYASITGGAGNDAQGTAASVSGGYINHAEGEKASISGGRYSTASGNYSSVSGGRDNTASGEESSVTGGHENEAINTRSSVTGGYQNSAQDWWSTVSGGYQRTVVDQLDWRGGEYFSEQ